MMKFIFNGIYARNMSSNKPVKNKKTKSPDIKYATIAKKDEPSINAYFIINTDR